MAIIVLYNHGKKQRIFRPGIRNFAILKEPVYYPSCPLFFIGFISFFAGDTAKHIVGAQCRIRVSIKLLISFAKFKEGMWRYET